MKIFKPVRAALRYSNPIEQWKRELLYDLKRIGAFTDFNLCLGSYSKSYLGTYDHKKRRVTIYVYSDEGQKFPYPMEQLFQTLIHESVHAEQWHDPNFVRLKGVMHNKEFWEKYNYYRKRAINLGIITDNEN